MLRQRVLTAILLLLVLIPSLLWMPAVAWAMLMALVAAIAGWEWAAFMRWQGSKRLLMGGGVLFGCLLIGLLSPDSIMLARPDDRTGWAVYGLAASFWLLLVPFWLRSKRPSLPANPFVGVGAGIIVIVPAWLAMLQLRIWGVGGFVFLLIAVWLADVGAYAAGKNFGKHKLAPTISPGKTWEGAWGGALSVIIFGLVVKALGGFEGVSPFLLLLALLGLAVVSIVGDLFESMLKRQVGLKDSSQILPGHGGVMDRIDSLTSTLPLAALSVQLFHAMAV